VSTELTKKCQSEITKEVYTIRQDIPKHYVDRAASKSNQLSVQHESYYETDGVFCSVNCCAAYIYDNRHNPVYGQSACYLRKLHLECMGNDTGGALQVTPVVIHRAPSWRLLRAYGGFMSIVEFRAASKDFVYVDQEQVVTSRPKEKPAGYIFEEMYMF
jgi:hypothetical protein